MALRDLLIIKTIQVSRTIETSNGMGGMSSITTLATLDKGAALWSPSQSARYISDKMARNSSHILVTVPSDYTFTINDKEIIYKGDRYKINGPSDDVMNLGEIMVTPLERIQ
jgi:hypothetical protein